LGKTGEPAEKDRQHELSDLLALCHSDPRDGPVEVDVSSRFDEKCSSSCATFRVSSMSSTRSVFISTSSVRLTSTYALVYFRA
jgi:hypothetical protein